MSEVLRMKNEIRAAGLYDKGSAYDGMIGQALDELIDVFEKQGHSGFSANLTAMLFNNLVRGEVLSPLTGKPEEWNEVEPGTFQNKRMSAVFAAGPNGEGAYFLDGRVFVGKDGVSFTTGAQGDPERMKGSSAFVTFPCIPKTVYIHEGTPEAEPFAHVFAD